MEDTLNKEFRTLMRNHQRIVQNYLSKQGLYMGQPRVLFCLKDNPGISQKELSEKIEISKEATSVSVRRLEKNGFINRHECKNDRRIILLELSNQGLDIVSNLRYNFDKLNKLMFADLQNDETKELKRILEIMNKTLEKRLNNEKII